MKTSNYFLFFVIVLCVAIQSCKSTVVHKNFLINSVSFNTTRIDTINSYHGIYFGQGASPGYSNDSVLLSLFPGEWQTITDPTNGKIKSFGTKLLYKTDGYNIVIFSMGYWERYKSGGITPRFDAYLVTYDLNNKLQSKVQVHSYYRDSCISRFRFTTSNEFEVEIVLKDNGRQDTLANNIHYLPITYFKLYYLIENTGNIKLKSYFKESTFAQFKEDDFWLNPILIEK